MPCWPVYIVGGFFISLLLVDMINYSWDVLPYHAGLGIFFTGVYYLFCMLFGNEISMAVLFVPAIFILMFFLASWLLFNNIQSQQCCMTCSGTNASQASQASQASPASQASQASQPSQPVGIQTFANFWTWLTSSLRATPVPTPKCSKAT